jgi:hypothetical protein
MAIRQLRTLLPGTLVRDATRLELDAFLTRYGMLPMLLVRLGDDDADLRTGLQNLWLPGGTETGVRVAPMRFRTNVLRQADPVPPPRKVPQREKRAEDNVLPLLEKGPHFAAIIRRQPGTSPGPGGAHRISLGRTANNDIVLRHSSVSKFHASLEPTEDGTIQIVDNASTNKTTLNGTELESRTPFEARSGDRVVFGSVETVLWSPRALWESQHED